MELRIKISPKKISGFDAIGRPMTYAAIQRQIAAYRPIVHRNILAKVTHGEVKAYSLEKHRKVVEILPKPRKWTKKELKDNGFAPTDVKYFTRNVVTPAHWTATVYVFDLGMLKAAGKRIVQHARHFELVDD